MLDAFVLNTLWRRHVPIHHAFVQTIHLRRVRFKFLFNGRVCYCMVVYVCLWRAICWLTHICNLVRLAVHLVKQISDLSMWIYFPIIAIGQTKFFAMTTVFEISRIVRARAYLLLCFVLYQWDFSSWWWKCIVAQTKGNIFRTITDADEKTNVTFCFIMISNSTSRKLVYHAHYMSIFVSRYSYVIYWNMLMFIEWPQMSKTHNSNALFHVYVHHSRFPRSEICMVIFNAFVIGKARIIYFINLMTVHRKFCTW